MEYKPDIDAKASEESGVSSDSFNDVAAAFLPTLEKEFFFIVGMQKSGTTWLQYLLHEHCQIVCRGESNFNIRLEKPLAEVFTAYNDKVSGGGDKQKTFLEQQDYDWVQFTTILRVMAKWCEEKHSADIKVIGERTPNFMYRRMVGWNRYFPKAKFIHIIRDPRDAAVSGWFFWLRRSPEVTFKRYNNINNFALIFIKEWEKKVGAAREYGRTLGDRYCEVKYEDLNVDPIAEATRLAKYLNVDSSEQTIEACIKATSFEKLSGRLKGEEDRSGSKFRKGVVGDWVNHLDKELVDALPTPLFDSMYR